MALVEPLYKLSEICSFWGVKDVVICPGSRSAPLTLAFSRNSSFKTHTITDERSAGFVALGMAQVSNRPVVLICTSGTAALNFSPAVAEAFFQKIPLIVLTADRPPEWINQHDGQTIYQRNVFGAHVVKSYEFPVAYTHEDAVWQAERISNEALAFCRKGPIHINIPIREPFYPNSGEEFSGISRKVVYHSTSSTLDETIWQDVITTWNNVGSVVIAVGQNHSDLSASLRALSQDPKVSVWTNVISNVEDGVCTHDTFLPTVENQTTDLLITVGQSFISKSIKQYFRKNRPAIHWHIEEETPLTDPFQSITDKFEVNAAYFLGVLAGKATPSSSSGFRDFWLTQDAGAKDFLKTFLDTCPFGELKATELILRAVSGESILHLGNSMPVRYANLLGSFLNRGVQVFSNRGTSGIDGIVSTSVGHSLATEKVVHCLVGDVSFFYDSNALFTAVPANLRIYLINNGGGNIFRIIDGPSRQAELESHFVTNTGRTASNIAQEAGLVYCPISSANELEEALNKKEDHAVLYEIFVNGENDAQVFKNLKQLFSK